MKSILESSNYRNNFVIKQTHFNIKTAMKNDPLYVNDFYLNMISKTSKYKISFLHNLLPEKLSVVNMASHPDNASPLLKACENGHDLCVKQLLDCQANPEERIVAGHRKSGSEYMVKFLDPLQCATRRNYLRYDQNERAS